MGVFDDAVADLHTDEDLTIAASYRRPPYTWTAVRAILSQPATELGGARSGALQVSIPAAGLSDAPRHGDQVKLSVAVAIGNTARPAGTVFTVEDAEPDDLALSYALTLADENA